MTTITSSRPHLVPALYLLLIAFVFAWVSCGFDRARELQTLVPGGDQKMIRALATASDPALASVVREAGAFAVIETWRGIAMAYQAARLEGRESDCLVLDSPLQRIGMVLHSEYGRSYYTRFHRYNADTPDSLWRDCHLMVERRVIVTADTSLTPTEKIDALKAMLERATPCKHPALVGQLLSDISDVYAEIDKGLQLEYLHRSIEENRRNEFDGMLCQLYGVIGNFHANAGQIDSAFYYLDEGLRLAHAGRFPYQAARITTFLSAIYRGQGRFALAHRLRKEAIEVCRRYQGGESELFFVLAIAGFYGDLGCWDIVDRLMQSAAVFDVTEPGDVVSFNAMLFHITRARLLMRQDKVDEAEAILRDLLPRTRFMGRRNHYPATLFLWGGDLVLNDLPARAIPRIREGIDYCRKRKLPELSARFHVLLATAYYDLGDFPGATSALDDYLQVVADAPEPSPREQVAHDALRIRVAEATGRHDETVELATRAFARLRSFVRNTDASSHGYIWLNSSKNLRAAIHDVLRSDPRLGYGFEMRWQELYAELGRSTPPNDAIQGPTTVVDRGSPDELSIVESSGRMADSALSRLSATDNKHLVYVNLNDETWLFTADSSGVRRNLIPATTPELRKQVAEAWGLMSKRPSVGDKLVPRALVGSLSRLARVLLPPTDPDYRRDGPGLHTLYITADDFLGMIPFETLNLADEGNYVPLLQRYDVAYARSAGVSDTPEASGKGLIVSDPQLSPAIQRRLGLEQDLTGARREAEAIRQQFGEIQWLQGVRCSKANLMSLWEDTEFLFIAAHFLQDPDLPYLTLLPLAAPPSEIELGQVALDVEDIRRANLSACRLAVLSGCSTGAPYVSSFNFGPGFGDAFIDAGVGQVMQTFWDVDDTATQELISDFVMRWRSTGVLPIRALCDARRDRMLRAGKIGHPNDWAAFSIKLRSF